MALSDTTYSEVKGVRKVIDLRTKLDIDNLVALPYLGVERTNEFVKIINSYEGMGGTRELTDDEEPDTNALIEGYQTETEPKRWGNSIIVNETQQIKMKDDTMKVRDFLLKQANSLMIDNKSRLAVLSHAVLNDALTGTTYQAPDSVALCGTHSWNTTGADTFTNSATAKLTISAWDAVEAYAGAFKSADGKPDPKNFNGIVVAKGGAASRLAIKMFAEKISPVAIGDINMYQGSVTIFEDPYITDTNAWLAADLDLIKRIGNPVSTFINKDPIMNEPIIEKNRAVSTSVTWYANTSIVALPTAWYGSTGAV